MFRLAAVLASMLLTCLFLPAGFAQSQTLEPSQANVLTYHNDNQRSGVNPMETTLRPSNVNAAIFGKVNFLSTHDRVRVEPLYVSGLMINGGLHNAVYVEDDSGYVYAFDGDDGSLLWQVQALGVGETTAPFSIECPNAGNPGIVGTPVIDLHAGPHGAIYFVAASYNPVLKTYHHRLHALDLTTGAELFGGPTEISATYPGTGDNSFDGMVIFDPAKYFVRAGLLEANGSIYFGFTSLCDQRPYTGWLLQYSASTLQQQSVLNVTPNANSGAFWGAGGGGFAADSDGYLYILDANGTFDTILNAQGFPAFGDYGNAFLKISGQAPMAVVDYFAMYNTVEESDEDSDLGSGDAMVIDVPSGGGTAHLVLGAGKDGHMYVANRNNMGKWNPLNNDNIYQYFRYALPTGQFGAPAFFNNVVYYGALYAPIKAFPVRDGFVQPAGRRTPSTFTYPGTVPSISSNQLNNGVVWAVENGRNGAKSVLHAYPAADVGRELYNSNRFAARDQLPGDGNKFVTPMIAGGRVYVATRTGVAVYGLLSQAPPLASHQQTGVK
jgi:outer membrane protein assembly factor BamB